MLRKSRLSAAVAFALASAAVVATPVLAEEGQNVEKLQKIKVTGSRISRVDVEGATPVVSVTKAKIEQSGQQTVADYLKQVNLKLPMSYLLRDSFKSPTEWLP